MHCLVILIGPHLTVDEMLSSSQFEEAGSLQSELPSESKDELPRSVDLSDFSQS